MNDHCLNGSELGILQASQHIRIVFCRGFLLVIV